MSAESAERPARAEMARVFFALWPPEEIARQLAGIAADFSQAAGGRPMCCETIHLTLAFLGDVAVERLPALQRMIEEFRCPALDLTLDRFGVWAHNRLFWAGCIASPPLFELASTLKKHLLDAGFAVAEANRQFAPHVTLVRKLTRMDLAVPEAEALSWRCREFVLVRSRLSDKGSTYEVLERFPLADEAEPLSFL